MRIGKRAKTLTSILLMCALAYSGFPAAAVAAGAAPAAKRAASVAKKAPAAKKSAKKKDAAKTKKKAPKKTTIPKKYAAQILREHDAYIEAFINAEMGARYYCKRIYDAIYRGKKTPSQEELDAMAYEVTRLRKELSSVAKRYALNIRVAKRMAVSFMNEEERTMLAEALSFLFATPAYAAPFNLSSLDGIEAGLNSIADGTPDINMPAAEIDRLRKEEKKRQREMEAKYPQARKDRIKAEMADARLDAAISGTLGYVARAGEVAAAGTAAVAGLALFFLSAPSLAPAVAGMVGTTAGTYGAVFVVTSGVVGSGLAAGDSILGFVDVATDKDRSTERKDFKKITVAVNAVNVVQGAVTISSETEAIKAVVDGIGWVQSYEDMLDACEDPKAPGRKGAKAVKRAAESASDAKRENKDNGGHDGCGH